MSFIIRAKHSLNWRARFIITRARNRLNYLFGDPLLREVISLVRSIPTDCGGGCSVQKAFVMAWLIRRFRLRCTVEIGVYRGRSFFPQALAQKMYTSGVAYGVDPWSREEAREQDNPELFEQIEEWADTTDFEAIYRYVVSLAEQFGPHCKIVRKPSREAVEDFKAKGIRINMLHVDGNHDRDKALADVEMYIPLLEPDGFVVMDDISWQSVRPAYELCAARFSLVTERTDLDYAIFQNSTDAGAVRRKLAKLQRLAVPLM